MESLSVAQFDLQPLIQEFENLQFLAFKSTNESIICFACYSYKAEHIINNWEIVQNFIAGLYQASDKRAMWNYYLALFCGEQLPIRENYKIQNDRFCARKIIYDRHFLPFTSEAVQTRLSEDILGSSLKVQPRNQPEPYECTLCIDMKEVPLSYSITDKSKRRQILSTLIEELAE